MRQVGCGLNLFLSIFFRVGGSPTYFPGYEILLQSVSRSKETVELYVSAYTSCPCQYIVKTPKVFSQYVFVTSDNAASEHFIT